MAASRCPIIEDQSIIEVAPENFAFELNVTRPVAPTCTRNTVALE